MTAEREAWIAERRRISIAAQQREDDIMAGCTCPEGYLSTECRLHGPRFQ